MVLAGEPRCSRLPDEHPLIVFDGECVLCSANAQFVLRSDRHHRLRLTTAQGPLGQALYRHFGLRADEEGTMIVLRDGQLLTKSDAAVAIGDILGWPWRTATLLKAIPRPVRDRGYHLLARNRFRLFGRRKTCWTPAPGDRDRIL